MPRETHDDEPEYIGDDFDTPRPEDRPHPKSRLMGALLLFLGAMMSIVIAVESHKLGGRTLGLVAMLAGGGSWVGLGLLAVPWTRGMVEKFTAENNFMVGFRGLPVFWKVWLILAAVVTVATFVVAVRLQEERAPVIVLPG